MRRSVLVTFSTDFSGVNCELTDLEPCIERDDCSGHTTCASPFAVPECREGWTGEFCTDSTFDGEFDPECPFMDGT